MATDNTLQSIELITTEPRCMAGQTYGLGYRLNPSEYYLRTESGSSRTDIRIFTEVDDPDELILSHEISSWNSRMVNNIRPVVVFKEAVTGTVGVRMCVEDIESGNVIRSNTLILNVYNDPSIIYTGTYGTGGTKQFYPPSNPMPITTTGGAVDCTQYLVTTAERQSKYFYLSTSASCVGIDTDGVTLIPKKAGSGLVWAMTHVAFSSTNTGNPVRYDDKLTKIDSWKSFTVTVYDEAEELADTMNLRFRIPEIVIDRSYSLFYSSSSRDILQGTNYTWPYENEDGERDKRLQLYDKYGSTNYEDFLEYDDPNGYFDSSRLSLWFENSEGEHIVNSSIKDAGVLCAWEEGTIYLVACYGVLSSTQQRTRTSIPFTMETRNPNFIPIRYTFAGLQTPRADEMDFSAWLPATEVLDIVPLDATINVSNFSMTEGIGDLLFTERIGTSGTLNEQYRVRISGIGQANVSYFCSYKNGGNFDGEGGIFKIGLPYWDGYRYIEACAPSSRAFVPSKSEIKKGEYVFIELQNNPDEEYTLNSTIITYKYVRYSVNSGEPMSASSRAATVIAEVICESRRGVILKGLAPGTINLGYG